MVLAIWWWLWWWWWCGICGFILIVVAVASCVCGCSLEIPLWILCSNIKAGYKRDYSGVRAEEETSKQVLWREVRVLGYNCHAFAKEEGNDIFKNVKALVKKRTGLAISYSRLLFSPFLLARKATEQLYKSLTPSSATHPLFLVCWTHDSKSIVERGKLQFVGKIHLISPPPASHTTHPLPLSLGFILVG